MPRYSCITDGDEFFHSGSKRFRNFAKKPVDLPHKGLRWVPVTTDKPDYDPKTQVRSGPEYTIGRDAVTESWSVRDKTSEELEQGIDERVASLSLDDLVKVLTAIVNAERENRSTPANPITEQQFRTFAKNIIRG